LILKFEKDKKIRRLLFTQVTDMQCNGDFPPSGSGWGIYDIRSRGWENVAVYFNYEECGPSKLNFIASSVEEIQPD
jgi:hypothetical protein